MLLEKFWFIIILHLEVYSLFRDFFIHKRLFTRPIYILIKYLQIMFITYPHVERIPNQCCGALILSNTD